MQMTSLVLFFFVFLLYILLNICNITIANSAKSNSIANWILLLASYLFVIYADYRFAIVLAIITLTTHFFATRTKIYYVGIIIALLALGYFKYMNFFAQSFAGIFKLNYVEKNIILPIGISFYTFSAISYIVDVHRKKVKARRLKDVALYLAFFPKITSGPVQKSEDFFRQIDSNRKVDWSNFSMGIQIFMFGLFKKIVLADRLSVFVNQVYDTPKCFGSCTVFLATIAYSFQIYFDFSGYSDMAIGIAKIIGINLPRNFNLPYLSQNVTELWKRWHITLSNWLQEYLYISLGGNRKGEVRTYVNLILTMVLGGIWHGASGTYIVWGILHGLALAFHKLWMRFTGSSKKTHSILVSGLSMTLTFLFTTFCWVFFRATTISQALEIIKRIFSFTSGVEQPYMWLFIAMSVYAFSVIFAYVSSKKKEVIKKNKNSCGIEGFYPLLDLNKFWSLVAFFVFCGLILCLAYTGGSPFIYGNY